MDSLMSNKEGGGNLIHLTASPHQSSNSIGRLWNRISSVTSFISSYRLQPHLSLHLSVNHGVFTRGRWKMTGRGSQWCQPSWGFSVLLQDNCLDSQEQWLLHSTCGITIPKPTTLFNRLSHTTNISSSRGYKQLRPSVWNRHLFRTSPDFNQDSFMPRQTTHLNSHYLDFCSSKTTNNKKLKGPVKFSLLYHIFKILTIAVTLRMSVHQINSVLLQIQSKV